MSVKLGYLKVLHRYAGMHCFIVIILLMCIAVRLLLLM